MGNIPAISPSSRSPCVFHRLHRLDTLRSIHCQQSLPSFQVEGPQALAAIPSECSHGAFSFSQPGHVLVIVLLPDFFLTGSYIVSAREY